MRERGVTQRGEQTLLVWGDVKGENGRDKVGITTTLHQDEELRLVASARAASGDMTTALTPAQIAAAVTRFPELDFTSELGLGLTRFRGHPEAFTGGIPDAQDACAVFA